VDCFVPSGEHSGHSSGGRIYVEHGIEVALQKIYSAANLFLSF
jgi:hypothetical protein